MPLPVLRLRAKMHGKGLETAPKILTDAVVGGLEGLGKLLIPAVAGRMRATFTGAEKRNLTSLVSGRGVNKSLEVFGTLVQTFIDELGLPPGTFPPWDVDTLIFKYVRRRGLVGRPTDKRHYAGVRRRARKVVHVRQNSNARRGRRYRQKPQDQLKRPLARRSAKQLRELRKNARRRARDNATRRLAFLVARAIFERGIAANKPFANTLEAYRARITREVANAFIRAVNTINRT
jgi:hypothetical protein